jgi:rSAM/selenodomain-associated transferase 1
MSVIRSPGRGARALVVAKAPAAGRTKTRLVPALTPLEAVQLGRAMLLDTLDGCRAEVHDTGLLYARAEERAELADLAGPGAPLVLQLGEGLGDALPAGAAAALAERDAVALVSSDIPGVPAGALTRALGELARGADVVVGPSYDGGYWLVALSAPHFAPFEDIPWSTSHVLAATLDRCRAAGLTVSLLDPWRDVDRLEDLAALATELDRLPGRRTARLIQRLVEAGTVRGAAPNSNAVHSEEVSLP